MCAPRIVGPEAEATPVSATESRFADVDADTTERDVAFKSMS